MRIFLAGASGTIGRRLLPLLIAEGHDVVGTTRTAANLDRVAEAGAEPVLMDGLDPGTVKSAVAAARPEVVINQLTALSERGDLKKFDVEFAETNQLRTVGNDHLLAAAGAAEARRFIAQSFTGWTNEHSGGPVKDESDPLDPDPQPSSRRTLEAIRHLENAVAGAADLHGIVLRYGGFYGPGTGFGEGGSVLEAVRRHRFPVVGAGTGVFSFIHIDDAARATVRALDHGTPGVYNIVDDEPAPVREWLPYLAEVLGARPPRHVPAWLARPMIGAFGVAMMTTARGSSNARSKRDLQWNLEHPTWRQGFRPPH